MGRRRVVWLVISALAFTAMVGAARATAQTVADTDDVLSGTSYLVRSDDLVVADPASISSTETKAQYFGLDTDDMTISTADTVAAKKVVDLSCVAHSPSSVPFPQQTQTMRMFNLPNDVIVTFAPTEGAGGTDCSNQQAGTMTFYIDDPVAGRRYTSIASIDVRNRWLHTAVGDFNGDGFDDLFISTDEWTYIATANDTSSPASGVSIVASLQTGSGLTPMADPTVGDFNNDGNLDVAWMGTGFSSGNTPVVHLATVCPGPVANTVCEGANPFDIVLSSATITPSAPTGSIVTVGGKCTQNDNNQDGSELRAPAMAVAAGQYDGTGGDELLVVPLYEDSGKECKVVAEVYSFTPYDVIADSQGNVTSVTGDKLSPKFEHELDNLGPHGHISTPSSIYATAGRLDWSAARDNVAIAISGGTDHNVLVIAFDANLTMTSQDDPFSTDHDKSFAGLAIGRFSSAPTADTSTSCSRDGDCTDTCKSSVCAISGYACTADGDCMGSCTSDGVCSYIKPNNYNLQIAAFLMARSTDHSSLVFVYGADPDSTEAAAVFPLKQIQQFSVQSFLTPAVDRGIRAGSLLRAGDLQGRSQRLGAPSVVRVQTSIQPDLVVGAPPMQADWLSFGDVGETEYCNPTPNDCPTSFSTSNICNCTDLASDTTCADGSPLRCLMNFSMLPSEYNSEYSFAESNQSSKSTTDMSSWSLGASVKLSEKTKSLTPTGIEFTQEVSFAASNTYDHSVSKTNSSYEGSSESVSAKTGLHDFIWYTSRDYNVYYYPVLGQTVCVDSCQDGTCSISTKVSCSTDADCPNDATTCPVADQQQLYVQYSGDTSVSSTYADDSGLEWYQPVHEPGQILSYPSSCAQLASRYGVNICDANGSGYSLLSEAASFKTDESDVSYSLNWSAGSGSSKTVSNGGQFSQSLTETMTASTPSLTSSVAGAKLSESISINANEALSTARTNSSSLDASTGITVGQPGTFLDPDKFAYFGQGYIFGSAPAPGTLQPLTPTSAEVQTNGVLRTAFTVDVKKEGSGSWWQTGAYNHYVDLALNRPVHLSAPPGKGSSDPSLTQCRPVSAANDVTADCISYDPADPTPQDLWSDGFYQMRGFFITPAATPSQGPQLEQANEGDLLSLQARVYNYSLQDMPQGTQIKVDFYAQPWDATCSAPAGYYNHSESCTQPGGAVISCQDSCDACCIANQAADSLFLGEDTLDPLPGFESANHPGQPNWALANTTFDTGDSSVCGSGGCGDKYFVFWVVTYLQGQDINGNPALVQELPDHSLTGIPGPLKSIADLCPKDNSCVNGSCRATRGACTADSDCPGAADNTCATNGTCAVSGRACTSNSDCGNCLCNTCIDEFSNNVGYYHVAFYVAPATTEASQLSVTGSAVLRPVAALVQGKLQLDRVSVTPEVVLPGQKTVVRAAMRALGNKIDGQVVRFYAIPPTAADMSPDEVIAKLPAFDEEVLSRIRSGRVSEAQVPFVPREIGRYQILATAVVDGRTAILGTADLDVGETPPPTPTATVPATTPTVPVPTATAGVPATGDGCAISDSSAHGSNGLIALLLFAALFSLLRSRGGRVEGGRVENPSSDGQRPAGQQRKRRSHVEP